MTPIHYRLKKTNDSLLTNNRCTASHSVPLLLYPSISSDLSYLVIPFGMDFSIQYIMMSYGLYFLKIASTTSFLSQNCVKIMSNKKITVILFWSVFTVVFVVTCFISDVIILSLP